MNGPEIMMSVAADIERQLHDHHAEPPPEIGRVISPWVAKALMQKAIRRRRTDLALAAANVLHRTSPDSLWRRLVVIAVEDVGLGDLDTVYMTIVAASQRGRLARYFGSWRLASLVVSRLAAAPKCRACDDLFVATEDCPAWSDDRLELAEMEFGDLLDVIAGDDPIERRAIAMRYAVGTVGSYGATALARRRGHPDAVFDFMCEAGGFAHTLVEITRAAFRITREPFTGLLPLLHPELNGAEAVLVPDDLPPEALIGGVPGWTYDKFSREGRTALGHFLNTDCPAANWLRLHVPPSERIAVLGHALFRVESGLVTDRLVWPTAQRLRRQADYDSWLFSREDAAMLLDLLRTDIGVLNRVREASLG